MSATTSNTKKITLLGMLAAIAYAVIFVCHFLIPPVAGFLTLDVKDTIIAIAGFIFGPLSAALVGVVVAAVEMVTISATGPIGLVMNILSSCCFACSCAVFKASSFSLVEPMASFKSFCFCASSSVFAGSSFNSLLTSFNEDWVDLIVAFTFFRALSRPVVSPPISTVIPLILLATCTHPPSWQKKSTDHN